MGIKKEHVNGSKGQFVETKIELEKLCTINHFTPVSYVEHMFHPSMPRKSLNFDTLTPLQFDLSPFKQQPEKQM